MLYFSLSTLSQAAYANLSSAAMLSNVRNIASVPGSFSLKKIKGKTYWYYQAADLTGKQKQIYLGRATDELTALIDVHRSGNDAQIHLQRLARQAISTGCTFITPTHGKILLRLADAGFFKAGGILVGTHVFMGYQNYLGIQWRSGAQTQDLDFAHAGKNVSIAIPSDVVMDMGSAIESLKMGFVPVQSLTTYVKADESDLQIDFVTSRGRTGDTPVLVEALNAKMQPLKFMEFSMESPIQMTLVSQHGPILVNAPPPEKYAVHKLLVHGERPQNMRVKASKDLEQSASLVSYLGEHDRDALREAWSDLVGRGPGWKSRAMEGLAALKASYPDLDVSALSTPAKSKPASAARRPVATPVDLFAELQALGKKLQPLADGVHYVGKIQRVVGEQVVQGLGGNKVVVHQAAKLAGTFVPGQDAEITYRKGRGHDLLQASTRKDTSSDK